MFSLIEHICPSWIRNSNIAVFFFFLLLFFIGLCYDVQMKLRYYFCYQVL